MKKNKSFLVSHKKSKRQQNQFDKLFVTLRHLPESLARITINCSLCNAEFQPNWFEKHQAPIIPVKPRFETKGAKYTGPARWILQQVQHNCPNCAAKTMINMPTQKMLTKGSLFGDDAERIYGNKKVSIYSLVGADQSLLPELNQKVNELKQDLIPSIPAESWKIHMKDLWAGGNRERHPVFNSLNINEVAIFVEKLIELIKTSNLFIYNIAVATNIKYQKTKKTRNRLRDEAYLLLVLNAIDEWTAKNAQPNIFFDSEKDLASNVKIHGWARDVFKGNQYALLYGFLSKGIEIPEPQFVPPASFPGLELADFVSYTIGRYYLQRWQKKEIEIDPEKLGLVTYLGYDSNGDFLWKRQEGYPWDNFHEIKAIQKQS